MKLQEITLKEQPDGNWIGTLVRKDGLNVTVRQSDPGIVLQMLLTHP